jgi:sterol desaturase/sphingolipid hydroxylase (fatty acid hydroxylase superfamily)
MADPHLIAPQLVVFAVDVVRLVIWLVLLVSVFVPLEQLFALHPAKFWRKQTGVDLAWYFINSLLPAAIIALPLAMLARLVQGADPGGLYSALAVWPLWLRLPLVFLVNDLGVYWYHRASHAYPLLWRFHAIHHSAEHVDWLVNTRAHPVDMVFTRLAGLVPVYLLGLAQTTPRGLDPAVALVIILGTLWSFFIHANIRCRLGALEWLVSSPAFHHWHHTNDEHRDRNFAAIFPLFDRVFGTAWLPGYWPPVYGIDAPVPPTLTGQLLVPLDVSGDRNLCEAAAPTAGGSACGGTRAGK